MQVPVTQASLKSDLPINQNSPPCAKIALFRSLFRGREDLYPQRFESKKTRRAGYSPACGNEWIRGICEKPKIKCSECRNRRFLSVTDDVVRWHLSGHDDFGKDFVMGIYPMLLDETCFFLAADFDKSSWQEDSLSFLKTCQKLNVPAAIERSRSGKGAHVWIFFSERTPAVLARKLGCHILTETMENCCGIGLDSYDRFFPNQDTLPQGGFGNLIALPLQKRARDLGHSVFVNDEWIPYEDQWAFLSSLQKINLQTIEAIVRQAESKGRIIGSHLRVIEEDDPAPWNRVTSFKPVLQAADMPESLEIIIGNEIYIPKNRLPPALKNRLVRLAAFPNPEFYKAQAMRLPTHDKPRLIACCSDHADYIAIPRGCLEDLFQLFADLKIRLSFREELQRGIPLKTKFLGKLRDQQEAAATALLKTDIGVLSATTAFGKTVIGAWLIAKRKVNTLVLVHRKQLQEQWIERLTSFLELPKGTIGRIGGGKRKPTGLIDIAVIQSLVCKGIVDEIVTQYGHIIVDECHHLPASSFEQVVRSAKAKYLTGLTATVTRKDGHHPIILMHCGPIRYRVDAKLAASLRPFEHTVFVRPTSFSPTKPANEDLRLRLHDLYQEIIQDEGRNQLICSEVISAVQRGRCPIILTEFKRHLDILFEKLSPHIKHLIVLQGGMSAKTLKATYQQIADVPGNEPRVLLAIGKFVGEGFDDSRLDTLFLTMPVSWKGTIAQYVGRLHRLRADKKEVQVYDYADLGVSILEKMFNRRCQGYEAVGYKILLPASAIPGWPAEAPLPVDPAWKADYAGSVKRLVRDGIDLPLAHLFVQVATILPLEAEGIDRARSASERFLFQRLETLPQTKGLFRLNVELDIPFDGWGRMEVDLVCAAVKLAIEIDGSQHLNSVEAYRRDRRKDLLLQENGYKVLRFLAEDVGKCLDDVLDTILRILNHQQHTAKRTFI
jgi:superfamily II DNA or RNA helicase/very-short-patch-repair endonuclease